MFKKSLRFGVLTLSAIAAIALLSVTPQMAQEKSREELPEIASEILRSPSLSPDGKTFAFSFDGDLWEVASEGGDAKRLTITEDNDARPIYSPNGEWIAFSSNRFGSSDVFVMPAGGGQAKRLTFDDVGNTPVCWLPDSSGVLFTGFKGEYAATLQCVKVSGGNAWPVIRTGYLDSISDAAISADGKTIAYVRRGRSTSYRQRGYTGSRNSDIWLADFDGVFTSNHRQFTDSQAHDFAPEFVGGGEAIVFCTFDNGNGGANRVSHMAMKIVGSDDQPEALPFGVSDIRSLQMASGKVIVTTGSYGGWGIYSFDEESEDLTRVKINLRRDTRNVGKKVTTLKTSTGFSVSPDGKKIAMIAGDDVYIMPTASGGVPKRLTNTVVREHNIQWAPDSIHISFTRSDIKTSRIRIMNTATGQEGYLGGSANRHSGLFSPDGKWFYYVTNNFNICRSPIRSVDPMESHAEGDNLLSLLVDTRREVVLVEDEFFMFSGMGTWGDGEFGLSHDGRWLTFLRENERYDREIWLCDMDADWPIRDYPEGVKTTQTEIVSGSKQEPIKLISMFGSIGSYGMTRDGKRIAFAVNTEGGYDNGDANIWTIQTQRSPVTFAEDKLEEAIKATLPKKKKPAKEEEKKDPKEGKSNDAAEDEATTKASDINFKDIRRRLSRSTSFNGNENWIVGGKSNFFFTSKNNIWSLNYSSSGRASTRQMTKAASRKDGLELSKDGKTLWFLDNGVISSMNASSGATKKYTFSVTQRRNIWDLRNVAINEAEGIIRDWFYDKNYHGVDIDKTFERYRQALSAVSTGDEYGSLMAELFGELNASHQGYTAPDTRTDGYRESIGWLGVCFDERAMAEGRFVVRRILLNGPCEQEGVDLQVGDEITHINDVRLDKDTPIESHMLDTVGKRMKLTLSRVAGSLGKDAAPVVATVKPITYQQHFGLFYGDWINRCRERVHAESNGKLGYVHIQSMNKASLIKFKQELGAEMLGREGVVIDVRHNGGGRTAVQILDVLYSKPWLQSITRHKSQKLSENIKGEVKLEKPTILLCNQNSFSNAEMITEGYKEMDLGKVVGMPTAGGVIWTWSSYRLSDGSSMRVTARGVYDMRGQNLENNGRTPNIEVDISPQDSIEGKDPQLSRAVKELLADVE